MEVKQWRPRVKGFYTTRAVVLWKWRHQTVKPAQVVPTAGPRRKSARHKSCSLPMRQSWSGASAIGTREQMRLKVEFSTRFFVQIGGGAYLSFPSAIHLRMRGQRTSDEISVLMSRSEGPGAVILPLPRILFACIRYFVREMGVGRTAVHLARTCAPLCVSPIGWIDLSGEPGGGGQQCPYIASSFTSVVPQCLPPSCRPTPRS